MIWNGKSPTDDPEKLAKLDNYLRRVGVEPDQTFKQKKIKYLETSPPAVEKRVDLVEFFERVKRHKADAWQIDFCTRIESAFLNRHERTVRALVHAEAQLGKSVILAQCYPAWILGHDPMHRIALATYNVTRSQAHSKAVIGIMNLPVYREMFPNPDSHVKPKTSRERWQTAARAAGGTEAQDSFNPVGLQSGLTGSGFDTLIIDDPYADQKEAFSETVRRNLQDFWEFTVESRLSEYANVFGMFHRYHVQDLAGYLLDKGEFDYWRYCSEFDGPYIHDETGHKFDDPLGREIGELISPDRRPASYYEPKRREPRVWNSMFQGRPSSEEGDFFNIGAIRVINDETEVETLRQMCSHKVRAYDNAATDEGGDWTVGVLAGIRANGRVLILDATMVQESTERRLQTQKRLASLDGFDVPIAIPQDPGSAGKDVVFFTQQELAGHTVLARSTSGSKEERARNFADAVNSGMVEIAAGDWNKQFLRALRDFPLSDFDDPVDAASDAYNHLYGVFRRGLVVKNFRANLNLLLWNDFTKRFGDCRKIPKNFTVYAGVKITPDASRPNSALVVARAPQNARMGEKLFVVAAYKQWTDNYENLFKWLDAAFDEYFEDSRDSTVWLHPDGSEYRHVLRQKLNRRIVLFEGDEKAGISEIDWYLQPRDGEVSPFNPDLPNVGMHVVVLDSEQIASAKDELGMYSFRQEASTWSHNEKGEPNAIGAVLDCLRMTVSAFHTTATPLTEQEEYENRLNEMLPPALRTRQPGEVVEDVPPLRPDVDPDMTRQMVAARLAKEIRKEGGTVYQNPIQEILADDEDEVIDRYIDGW